MSDTSEYRSLSPDDYDAGYDDGLAGRKYNPGWRIDNQLKAYAAGYTAGQIEASNREFGNGESND